jgi:predicted AlkP superfamily phosphohydrolase/phosphomutase
MPAAPRQLVIGVDAMEWSLVERWAAAGKLPTFRRLLDTGLRARLASTADCLPDTAWTTLMYGVNPGRLEKYFYVQYDPAAGRLRHVTDVHLRGTPFWGTLAAAGKRVGVVDVPHMPLQPLDDGFVLRAWGVHDNDIGAEAIPRTLEAEVQARFGRHPVGDCERYNAGERQRLLQDVLAGVRRHGEVFRWLMESRPWDMFMGVFSAPHCVGHHFWHDADRPEESDGFTDAVERTYRAIDREIGETMARAGTDAITLVVAAHGMGPLNHASWHLNEILDALGYGRPDFARRPTPRRRGRVNPWRILKMTLPSRWQYAIKTRLPESLQARLLYLWYAGGRRCGGRRAFAVPNNDSTGSIRIGVRGRDAGGLVAAEDYRTLRADITAALHELVDPASGRPVVAKVTAPHDVFRGPYVDAMPDLVVLWDSSFVWDAVSSPRLGTLQIRRQDLRAGSHTPNSFLLACGPGIPAGAEVTGRSTVDVAPTVLRHAGVRIPETLDGTPIVSGA